MEEQQQPTQPANTSPAKAEAAVLRKRWYKRRWFRWVGWTLTSLLLLLIIGLALVSWYVSSHKTEIIARITHDASEAMGGTITIGDVEPTILGDFPYASLVLKDVHIHDSLYKQHGQELLSAKEIFVRISPLKLLRNKMEIRRLTVANASIRLFTDSTGYTNAYLLKAKKEKNAPDTTKKRDLALNTVALREVDLTFINETKRKNFHLIIRNAFSKSDYDGPLWKSNIELDATIGGLAFNVDRGAFLEKAVLVGDIKTAFNTDTKILDLNGPEMLIDGQSVDLTGKFDFKVQGDHAFSLTMKTDKVVYKKALNWVTDIIASKLAPFDFRKPVAMQADIVGHMQYRDTPHVVVSWVIKDNEFITPGGTITECSFQGNFNNQAGTPLSHTDRNSSINLRAFTGKYEGIPIIVDSASVTNLIQPYLDAYIRSDFALDILNDIDNSPFEFKGGKANVRLHYQGGIGSNDPYVPSLDGQVAITNAAFRYIPRGVNVSNFQTLMQMQGDNLYLRNISMTTPGGAVRLEGVAEHFFLFYFQAPGKVNLSFTASSPALDLTVLRAFAGQRQATTRRATKAKQSASLNRVAAQLNEVLKQCSAHLAANIQSMKYGKFLATNVRADATLTESAIRLNNVSLNHGEGSLVLTAAINQQGARNPFTMTADIKNIVVDQLFRSTDNFGQKAIEADNLQGRITANVTAAGQMQDGGAIVPGTLKGKAKFILQGGSLKNFEPLMKISKYAFKNRGLDNIQFEKLEDELEFDQGAIIIHPLLIESSAFNLRVAGTYHPPKGTDIAITLPLGNPGKRNKRWKDKGKVGPGITLNLRATDGSNGKVHIGWDARKRSAGLADSVAAQQAEEE